MWLQSYPSDPLLTVSNDQGKKEEREENGEKREVEEGRGKRRRRKRRKNRRRKVRRMRRRRKRRKVKSRKRAYHSLALNLCSQCSLSSVIDRIHFSWCIRRLKWLCLVDHHHGCTDMVRHCEMWSFWESFSLLGSYWLVWSMSSAIFPPWSGLKSHPCFYASSLMQGFWINNCIFNICIFSHHLPSLWTTSWAFSPASGWISSFFTML